MAFPGFDHVYFLTESGHPEFRTKIGLSLDAAREVTRAELTPRDPVELRWMQGRRVPRDFIWTTLAVPVIVSERVVAILSQRRFLGWSVYPIAVRGPKDEDIQGYHGLAVRGRCGRLQPERSEEVQTVGPVGNRVRVYRGLYFDESAWDGSDLFMPSDQLSGQMFVTEPVRDVLLENKVKGAIFERLDLDERVSR